MTNSNKKIKIIDYVLKYIIIGDSRVGKSCLMEQFTSDKFISYHDITIGIDFNKKEVKIDNPEKEKGQLGIKISIWDTAGQEYFKAITRQYYRGSCACILVYDITNRESFQNIHQWIKELYDYSHDKIEVILVGNKLDLSEERKVSLDEGFQLSRTYNIPFIETSAKTGESVNDAFISLAERVVKKAQYGEIELRKGYTNNGITLLEQPTNSFLNCFGFWK